MIELRPTSSRIATRVGIPPVVVEAILLAVVQIVLACMTPAEAVATGKRWGILTRWRVSRIVWRELYPDGLTHRRKLVMDAIRAEMMTMTVPRMAAMYEDAVDSTGDFN